MMTARAKHALELKAMLIRASKLKQKVISAYTQAVIHRSQKTILKEHTHQSVSQLGGTAVSKAMAQ